MVKAVLSDIDGTLVESNWLHAEAWQVAFGVLGIHLEREALRRQIGKGGDELVPVFVPWWKREHVEEPLKQFRQHIFSVDYMPQVKPFAGVREFFLRLKAEGIRPALASSANREDLATYKRIANIEDLVDKETSASDAPRSKPHPDIFAAALARLKLPPRECIALGDTPYDAEAAGHAGMRTIGVMTGGWTREDLLASGCVEVYADIAELLSKIEQSAILREGLR